jgi:predicted deacylase
MRSFAIPVLALGLVAAAGAADLTIAGVTARPGERATGYLSVAAGSDPAASIPLILINGPTPGPRLALVAGAHGTEYASIIALEKLAQWGRVGELSGSLVILPLVNPASFLQKVPHVNPVDGKNMNRFYPGNPNGTQTERVSWAIAREVIDKCDYLIDFHGGDLDENLRRYSYWARTGNDRLDAVSRGMVLAFGLDHIIIQDYRDSTVPAGATPVSRYAASAGKPAIVVEAGHAGTTEPDDVEALVAGTVSVMRQLKMLPGKPAPVEHPLWIAAPTAVTSDRDGIFYPLTAPETYVEKGMRIGYLTDYFGEETRDIVAPVSGVVLYIGAVPSMKKGDTVAHIGAIAEPPR